METTVGMIGLGNAGLALASAILRSFTLVGFDRNPVRCGLADRAGVEVVSSPQAVAARCEILILSLPRPDVSRSLPSTIAPSALQGHVVVETSTVAPDDIDRLVEMVAPAGGTVVDAAIVGGVAKLTKGETTFLVGASEPDFARVKPVLKAAAETIFHLGKVGNGMRAKVVNNAVAHSVMVVLIEAAALAAAQGVPMDVFYELMEGEAGLLRPLTHRFGERIRQHDFEGGMSTANARKDSALAIAMAQELGVPLFAIPAAPTVYEIGMREGLERKDYAALATLWEKWTGESFAK